MGLIELRQELETKKNKTGLVGIRLDLSEVPGKSLAARITSEWRTLSIEYGTELDLVPDVETERFVQRREIINPPLKTSSDLLTHEAGHRENPTTTRLGCPYTVEMHDAIKEVIHGVLVEKGKASLEDYVTNAFEDILDNINCRRTTDFSGQTLFWNNQGLINSKEGKYSPFYEAFVRINLFLGGSIPDNTLLKRFYTDTEEVRAARKGFLQDLSRELGLERAIRVHEKETAFNTLFTRDLEVREQLWTRLARSFTEYTADLLDQPPPEMMFGATGENPFDTAMRLPKNKQEIAYKRYQEGKGPATHRDKHEQLYDLYTRISKEIKVESSSYTESTSMPLVRFGRRFMSEDERKLRFRGIGIKPDGTFGVKTTKHELEHPVSYKKHPRKFPKFKLVLMDRSGSMKDSPNNDSVGDTSFIPWGDNSKYHYALQGYFGIENFLGRQGISQNVENAVLGFSGENAIKGDAKSVARSLLEEPKGGTSLDIDGLERELTGEALVLSISDGRLTLTDDVKNRLKKAVATTDYAHIQIGRNTPFCDYLREIGVPVFPVQGNEDLSRTMITFVAGYYKAQGGEQR